MNYLLNFATPRYQLSQRVGNVLAQRYGLDVRYSYNDQQFKQEFKDFYQSNIEIFNHLRGFGYWLWKPYLIKTVLNQLSEGDLLIYADAGLIFIEDPEPLLNICSDTSQVFFALPNQSNARWCKRDLFIRLECDCEQAWLATQATGQCHLWKATQSSHDILNLWLDYSLDMHLIDDSPSVEPNHPDFKEHRHDQSILSLITYKLGLKLHKNPNQHGSDSSRAEFLGNYDQLALAVGALEENQQLAQIWEHKLRGVLMG